MTSTAPSTGSTATLPDPPASAAPGAPAAGVSAPGASRDGAPRDGGSSPGASVVGERGPGGRPAFVGPTPQEQAWAEAEAATIEFVSTINTAVAGLVAAVAALIAADGWRGYGVRSAAHWVAWKAGMAPHRARGLVAIAERIDELPECWAAFEAGRLTEDAMVLLARRVPAERDGEFARLAPELMVSQIQRLVAKLPDLGGDDDAEAPEPRPYLRMHTTEDGWCRGSFHLPPEEGEQLRIGLDHASDAEYRDRTGIDPHPDDTQDDPDLDPGSDESVHRRDGAAPDTSCACPASQTDADPGPAGPMAEAPQATPTPDAPKVQISLVDALVRLATEGTRALDAHHRRTGRPGERAKVVLHHDLDSHGLDPFGPGRLHLGAVVPDPLARYLRCDADISVATYRHGRLVGIHPTTRTVPTNLRRLVEDRDQGCTHPLCHQRRHLHIHHIRFWEDGGPTTPDNLVALCPTHHRQLHHGHFHVSGDPEAGTLTFTTPARAPLRPPRYGADAASPPHEHPAGPGCCDAESPATTRARQPSRTSPTPPTDAPYRPATGERLHTRWLSWN